MSMPHRTRTGELTTRARFVSGGWGLHHDPLWSELLGHASICPMYIGHVKLREKSYPVRILVSMRLACFLLIPFGVIPAMHVFRIGNNSED